VITQVARTNWNPDAAAEALGISVSDHLSMRFDGRRASSHVTDWLSNNGYQKISDNRSGTILKREGKTYRLRILTDSIQFSPSKSRGLGRAFRYRDFQYSVSEVDGYLVVDAQKLPTAPVLEIPSQVISDWVCDGKLSNQAGASRETFNEILRSESRNQESSQLEIVL
jgi:hypothetical protein